MDKPGEHEIQEPMSDAVASAWADVIISIHERCQAEDAEKQRETHLGPGVTAGHGSTGGDLPSSTLEVPS
jgi:hypothetical protein